MEHPCFGRDVTSIRILLFQDRSITHAVLRCWRIAFVAAGSRGVRPLLFPSAMMTTAVHVMAEPKQPPIEQQQQPPFVSDNNNTPDNNALSRRRNNKNSGIWTMLAVLVTVPTPFPSALLGMAALTLVALVVHPDGLTWIFLRTSR